MLSRNGWVVVACALLAVGCNKKTDAPESGSTSAAASGAAAAQGPNQVATYPDMIPAGGTRRVLQPLTVRQAPDPNAPVLTRLGVGTLVDLKGSRGAWMLIMWPSGVGQLSPGWVDLSVNDPRTANVEPSATATASAAPAVSASGKPIRLIPKKKK